MTVDDALALLRVTRDASPDEVRRAYLRACKRHRPESDPEGFQRVRAAYELLTGVGQPSAPAAPEPRASSNVDAWLEWARLRSDARLLVEQPVEVQLALIADLERGLARVVPTQVDRPWRALGGALARLAIALFARRHEAAARRALALVAVADGASRGRDRSAFAEWVVARELDALAAGGHAELAAGFAHAFVDDDVAAARKALSAAWRGGALPTRVRVHAPTLMRWQEPEDAPSEPVESGPSWRVAWDWPARIRLIVGFAVVLAVFVNIAIRTPRLEPTREQGRVPASGMDFELASHLDGGGCAAAEARLLELERRSGPAARDNVLMRRAFERRCSLDAGASGSSER